VAALSVTRKGRWFGRDLRVWESDSGRQLAEFRLDVETPLRLQGAVALSRDGSQLAFDDYAPETPGSTEWQPRVRLCDASDGREVRVLTGATGEIWALAFSPDGGLLAAGGVTGRLMVWDTTTGQAVLARDQEGFLFRLAFSPDGRRLAVADRREVRVWDVRAQREVLRLRGAPPRPSDGGFNPMLEWSPDSGRLATSNWDGSISVWDGTDRSAATSGPDRYREARTRAWSWHLSEAEHAAQVRQGWALAFHLARLRATEPPDVPSRLGRARLLLLAGDQEQAAADYHQAFRVQEPESLEVWLERARLLVLTGKTEEYRSHCARLLALWAASETKGSEVWIPAHACALGPGGSIDPAHLVRLAEEALAGGPGDGDRLFCLALAHYRAGQWEKALQRLHDSEKVSGERAWRLWPLRALIEHRLGNAAEARRWLARAAQRQEELTRTRAEHPAGLSFETGWAEFRILYTEAIGLFGPVRR
jgi:tetratricopeptide (TPR) repeat protein